jgi:hypothetical protein
MVYRVAANLGEPSKGWGVSGSAGKPQPVGSMAQDPCLPGGARACGGIRGRRRLAETGSAGRKGCGFQRVRVTEREDCLAVWKHSGSHFVAVGCHWWWRCPEREDCLAVWKLFWLGLQVTEREDCLAVWKHIPNCPAK